MTRPGAHEHEHAHAHEGRLDDPPPRGSTIPKGGSPKNRRAVTRAQARIKHRGSAVENSRETAAFGRECSDESADGASNQTISRDILPVTKFNGSDRWHDRRCSGAR
jgi:hypothetical protein